jgi:dihydroneopterin aldolase
VTVVVRLRGIEVEGRHGVFDEEQERPQPFVIDLELEVNPTEDDLAATADYAQVVSVVRGLMATESFRLIETLAMRVARVVADLPGVRSCRAKVHKPGVASRLKVEDVSAEAAAGDAS